MGEAKREKRGKERTGKRKNREERRGRKEGGKRNGNEERRE